MKADDYYSRQKGCERTFLVIIVLIMAFVFSCTKWEERYNYSCDCLEIRQYSGGRCPDTVKVKIFKPGITAKEQLSWIHNYQEEKIYSIDGDTLLVRNIILGCGKSVCP